MDEQKSGGPDKNTLIAILLCGVIWLGWQMYLQKKYPDMNKPAPETQQVAGQSQPVTTDNSGAPVPKGAPAPVAKSNESVRPPQPRGPEQTWNYEDANWKVTVSSWGGKVSQIVLKKYTDKDGQPIALVGDKSEGYLLTEVEGGEHLPKFEDLDYSIRPLSNEKVELTAAAGGVEVKKTLTVHPEKYTIDDETLVSGKLDNVKSVYVQLSRPPPEPPASGGIGDAFSSLFGGKSNTKANANPTVPEIQEYYFSYGSKGDRVQSTEKSRTNKNYDKTNFAALGSRYFTNLLFNRSEISPIGQAIATPDASILRLTYQVFNRVDVIPIKLSMYAGPKTLKELQFVAPEAGQVVDLGHFSWIAIPLLKIMRFFFGLFKNWGVAIIALTILVRLITYPFTYMSYKSMKGMQRIQPEMTKLKEKYKDNPQVLNVEMMKLMRENKVNPMGGCLPVVLQLPVFWALYTVLQNSIELYHAPFVLWIHDLSIRDPYYILPILMAATMLIQQKITPSTMDPAQAKMMLIMPLFFGLLMMNLPSGLTLYIFVSTLFGIIQQMVVMKGGPQGPNGAKKAVIVGTPVRGASK